MRSFLSRIRTRPESVLYRALNHVGVFDAEFKKVSKFFNRLLGCPVAVQAELFNEFVNEYESVVQDEKVRGTYSSASADVPGEKHIRHKLALIASDANGRGGVQLLTVDVDRRISFDAARILAATASATTSVSASEASSASSSASASASVSEASGASACGFHVEADVIDLSFSDADVGTDPELDGEVYPVEEPGTGIIDLTNDPPLRTATQKSKHRSGAERDWSGFCLLTSSSGDQNVTLHIRQSNSARYRYAIINPEGTRKQGTLSHFGGEKLSVERAELLWTQGTLIRNFLPTGTFLTWCSVLELASSKNVCTSRTRAERVSCHGREYAKNSNR
jgi:hypothetical protein